MDLLNKVRVVLGEEQVPGRGLRRPVDLLITKIVPGIILLCSFLITANRFLRKPVNCLNEPVIAQWPAFVENQCWVQGPYYLAPNQEIPDQFDEKDRLTYLAYLPYIFAFASLILFAPYFLFSLIMKPLSTKFEAIYSGCDMMCNTKDHQSLAKIHERICNHLIDLSKDRKYIVLFLIARVIYILSLFLVALFFSSVFGVNYFKMGFKSVFFFIGNNQAFVDSRFPLLAICNVQVREMINGASKNIYNVQCNLPTNLLLSKVVGIVFALLFFIAFPLAVFDTFYTFGYFLCGGKGFDSKTLVLFLIKDSVPQKVYNNVKNAYKTKMLQLYYMDANRNNAPVTAVQLPGN